MAARKPVRKKAGSKRSTGAKRTSERKKQTSARKRGAQAKSATPAGAETLEKDPVRAAMVRLRQRRLGS